VEGEIVELRTEYELGTICIMFYLDRYHRIKISDSTVSRIHREHRFPRLSKTAEKRAVHPKRYEKKLPGYHVQVVAKFLMLEDENGKKVSILKTTRDDWVLGIQALHGNPYDGLTLGSVITPAEIMSDGVIDAVFIERGYCRHDYEGEAEVHLAGKKKISRSLKRWQNRRNAIVPVIGHLKTDNRLDRNYLKGEEVYRINAILADCGFNFRRVHIAILFVPNFIQEKITQTWQVIRNIDSGQNALQMHAA